MTPLLLAMLSLLIGFFPLLVALLAGFIARLCDCELDEAHAGKCIVCGLDISRTLYAMFVFGWFGMLTMGMAPIGIIVSIVWALRR